VRKWAGLGDCDASGQPIAASKCGIVSRSVVTLFEQERGMKAIELSNFSGFNGLRVIEADTPMPGPSEVLIKVKASGINFAELELTKGRYPSGKQPPFIMGFEASGVVLETGSLVNTLKAGDRVAAVVSSGGYAEYATAAASACIPIPDGISFAEA